MSRLTSMRATGAAGLLVAIALVCSAALAPSPAVAAADPVGAAQALVARVEAGELDDLDGIVCPEEQAAVRAQFDIAAQMGATPELGTEEFASAIAYRFEDVSFMLLDEDADEATVGLEGRLAISMEPEDARAMVGAMVEALGGQAITDDEELDELAASMLAGFTEPLDLEEDLRVVRLDGEWVVCDDLGRTPDDGPETVEPELSFAGLCGLVSLDEVNTAGTLTYEESFGGEGFCSYSSTEADVYRALSATLDPIVSIEDYRSVYASILEDVTVAGLEGFALDESLYVGLPDGATLQVSLFVDGATAAEVDVRSELLAFAELIVPAVQLAAAEDASDPPAIEPEPSTDDIDLCGALSLEQLNALGPLQYDRVDGDGLFCSYVTDEASLRLVTISYSPGATLDDMRPIVPDADEVTVGGRPALHAFEQLFIETGEGLLMVVTFVSADPAAADLDLLGYGTSIASIILEALPTPGG